MSELSNGPALPWRADPRDPSSVRDAAGRLIAVAVPAGASECPTHSEGRRQAGATAGRIVTAANAVGPLVDVLQAAEETLRDETAFHLVALHEWILLVLESLKEE